MDSKDGYGDCLFLSMPTLRTSSGVTRLPARALARPAALLPSQDAPDDRSGRAQRCSAGVSFGSALAAVLSALAASIAALPVYV